ncbi:hypothetical protein [Acanthopleuribacter pedis]|uniref:Uncharacterized protein n=1 Tax=Acanthopleuribacter pedis TaxID=442870 RepID=A0A8J7QC94_9BACT|nr:hypothetical protein [Acanthopleuribacter pedis]MBO1321094.1 hypothetical protein [Acanthopleuribacter pedis]
MLEMMVVVPVDAQESAETSTRRFNKLHCELQCPQCWMISEAAVALPFGRPNGDGYRLGETLAWREGVPFEMGGRPADGHCVSEGAAQCGGCKTILAVSVHVWQDRLTKAIAVGEYRKTTCFSA